MEEEQKQSENEDIPSDFFDDFNKAEFIEGLSVIDSWDDKELKDTEKRRIDAETIDRVEDLRELIVGDKHHPKSDEGRESNTGSRYKERDIDSFVKSGSRRDPEKTNQAIKRDKDLKVKEFLAKTLGSSDIRPPGTELDEFLDENVVEKKSEKLVYESKKPRSRSPRPRQRYEPLPRHMSPRRNVRWSPHKRPHHHYSPPIQHNHHSKHSRSLMHRHHSRSPINRKYIRRSPGRKSPSRSSHHRSPVLRHSPGHRRSPISRHSVRNFSPIRKSPPRVSRHLHDRSPIHSRHSTDRSKDSFLYPQESTVSYNNQYPAENQTAPEYHQSAPITDMYGYPSGPVTGAYPNYGNVYQYQAPQVFPVAAPVIGYVPAPAPVPQPVPAPNFMSATAAAPAVPAPAPQLPSPALSVKSAEVNRNQKPSFNDLAHLLADGKISKEDFLKLTSDKNVINTSSSSIKEKVELLNRCHSTVSKLGLLNLPSRLVIHNIMKGQEPKAILHPNSSPLKRHGQVKFHFTHCNESSNSQQNKLLIDSIVATIGLDQVIARPKRKNVQDFKDASSQTTKNPCEICEIRADKTFKSISTMTDPQYFTESVQTQVLEQDLINSRAVFTPGGGVADGAPLSIAHLTPAQLVSQLAARAKTLKQTEPPSQENYYGRRPNYDRGNNSYNNFNPYQY